MNPSGQPFPSQFGGAPPPSGSGGGGGAREALNVPSILLIVFGAISVLYSVYGLIGGGNEAQIAQALSDPKLPPEAKKIMQMMLGPGVKVINLFFMALSGLMIFGAVQMRNLKSYGLAIAACVIGMIPCTSCCCVTLPIGIWTLTILMKPEIKSSFS